ncbi:MAG: ArsR/SmtB family transcription factor [Halothermotrichaceae bacterium]
MDLIKVLKALSHENRVRILNLLKERKLCVCELESIMYVNQSNASRHLNKLKHAGLITSEHDAQWVYYSLNSKFIKEHPFINEIILGELDSLKNCQEDYKRLKKYKESGLNCGDLRGTDIELDEL